MKRNWRSKLLSLLMCFMMLTTYLPLTGYAAAEGTDLGSYTAIGESDGQTGEPVITGKDTDSGDVPNNADGKQDEGIQTDKSGSTEDNLNVNEGTDKSAGVAEGAEAEADPDQLWYKNHQGEGAYIIGTAGELNYLAELVNGGTDNFKGKTIQLSGDVDLKDIPSWISIGSDAEKSFQGTFDGNKHVIKNLNADQEEIERVGLFGYIKDGIIENLGVAAGIIKGGTFAGAIAGYADGNTEIRNCYSSASSVGVKAESGGGAGGIVGYLGGAKVTGSYSLTGNYAPTVGSGSGEIKYSYYLYDGSDPENEQGLKAEDFNSGKLSWLLNTEKEAGTNSGLWSSSDMTLTGVTAVSKAPVFSDANHPAVYRVLLNNSIQGGEENRGTVECQWPEGTAGTSGENDYYVASGSTVTLKVTFNSGFDTYQMKITDTGSLDIENNIFTMPARDVALTYLLEDPNRGWYKSHQGDGAYIISTVGQLNYLAELVNGGTDNFKGKTILLSGDVDLKDIPSWTSIGSDAEKSFQGTFDGNKHVIKNLNADQEEIERVGLFGYIKDGIIENLGVAAGIIKGGTFAGAIAGYADGNTEIRNCYSSASSVGVKAESGGGAGGIVGYLGGAKVTGSYSLTGNYAPTVGSGSGEIKYSYYLYDGSDLENEQGLKAEDFNSGKLSWLLNTGNTAGTNSGQWSSYDMTLTGVTAITKAPVFSDANHPAVYRVLLNNTDPVPGNVVCDGYTAVGSGANEYYVADGSVVNLKIVRDADPKYAKYWLDLGSITPSDLTVSGKQFTVAKKDVTIGYTLVSDSAWYTEHKSETKFHIRSAEELAYFAVLVNNGITNNSKDSSGNTVVQDKFADKTVFLDRDIDLSGFDADGDTANGNWIPIGTYLGKTTNSAYYFQGIFDGQNHTISNLKITQTGTGYVGLFGYIYGSANKSTGIKNLNIEGGEISSALYAGSVAGQIGTSTSSTANVDNCSVKNTKINGTQYAGGMAGRVYGAVSNCTGENSTVSGTSSNVGGIAGYVTANTTAASGDITISNCAVKDITVNGTSNVGGIVGNLAAGSIDNCRNDGRSVGGTPTVLASTVGGIAGTVTGGSDKVVISNCVNTANVGGTLDTSNIGGIVGTIAGKISNCQNSGTVRGVNNVGGIAGTKSYTAPIEKSFNTGAIIGTISISADSLGGVVGNLAAGAINDSYNLGKVSSVSGLVTVGGIAGSQAIAATISNCFNIPTLLNSISNNSGSADNVKNSYYLIDDQGTETAAARKAAAFNSGEIAWLLDTVKGTAAHRNIWGQGVMVYADNVGLQSGPVFNDPANPATIYRIDVINQESGSDVPGEAECHWTDEKGAHVALKTAYVKAGTAVTLKEKLYAGSAGYKVKVVSSTVQVNLDNHFTVSTADVKITYKMEYDPDAQGNPQTWYNGQQEGAYQIGTAGELAYLAALVNEGTDDFAGKTVELSSDINLSGTGNWMPIGSDGSHGFKGTFDGKGHVIRNLTVERSDEDYAGLFGYLQNAVVTHVGVSGGHISGKLYAGGLAGYAAGNTSLSECYNTATVTVADAEDGVAAGIVGILEAEGTVDNAYSLATLDYPIAGGDGTVTHAYYLSNGTIDPGAKGTAKAAEAFNDGEVAWLLNTHEGEEANGGTWGKAPILFSGIQYAPVFADAAHPSVYKVTLNVDSGSQTFGRVECLESAYAEAGYPVTLQVKLNQGIRDHIMEIADVSPAGLFPAGTTGFTKTFDMPGQDVTITYKLIEGFDPADTQGWYDANPNGTEFHIRTAGQLNYLKNLVNINKVTFKGKTVYLDGDIDLQDVESWTPIGYGSDYSFQGVFDGQGHSIKNLNINQMTVNYTGLFGYLKNAAVKNLIIDGDKIVGKQFVGGVAGYAEGSLRLEHVSNKVNIEGKETNNSYAGGLVGWINYSSGSTVTLSNCSNAGNVEGVNNFVGGLVGQIGQTNPTGTGTATLTIGGSGNSGTIKGSQNVGGLVGAIYSQVSGIILSGTMTDCQNTGSVTSSVSAVGGLVGIAGNTSFNDDSNTGEVISTGVQVGGIAGQVSGTGSLSNCFNAGNVTSTAASQVGGVAGQIAGTGTVNNCINTGTIVAKTGILGGIIGSSTATGNIEGCRNIGEVSGEGASAGGIVGSSSAGTITGCGNTGKVIATGNNAGGIVGTKTNASALIEKSWNEGEISGAANVGGIAGSFSAGTTDLPSQIKDSYNQGKITGSSNAAGIAGSQLTNSTIVNCYNLPVFADPTKSISNKTGTAKLINCYYLIKSGTEATTKDTDGNITEATRLPQVFDSGEVAYLLNTAGGTGENTKIWGQKPISNAVTASLTAADISLSKVPVPADAAYPAIYKVTLVKQQTSATDRGTVEFAGSQTKVGDDWVKYAAAGETVKLVKNPGTGYDIAVLDTEILIPAQSGLTVDADGNFTMPSGDVKIGYELVPYAADGATFVVNFHANDADAGSGRAETVIVSQNLTFPKSIIEPDKPVWPGHTFLGWDRDNDQAGKVIYPYDFGKNKPVREDFTLYGKWKATEYKVIIDNQKDTPVPVIYPADAGQIAIPSSPSGANFKGWYIGHVDEKGKYVRSKDDQEMTAPIPLTGEDATFYIYAKYEYKVTFNWPEGGSSFYSDAHNGELLKDPFTLTGAPAKREAEKVVWYTDSQKTKPWDLGNRMLECADANASNELILYGSWQPDIDTSWYDEASEGPFELDSLADLLGFAQLVNGGNDFAGKMVQLGKDIDLTPLGTATPQIVWTPLGTNAKPFKGTFDGQGHTIKGLNINKPNVNNVANNYQALFGYIDTPAVLKNLTVQGSVTGYAYVAGLVASMKGGTIDNVYSKVAVTATNYVGGIAASQIGGVISNSVNHGKISGNTYVGGIAGMTSVNAVIKECVNGKNPDVADPDEGNSALKGEVTTTAGPAGGINGANDGFIEGCINYGVITATAMSNNTTTGVGGITGYNRPTSTVTNAAVKSCINYGQISGTSTASNSGFIGGIAARNDASITFSLNKGSLSGSLGSGGGAAGGIAGSMGSGSIIANNGNEGTINVAALNLGGVVGALNSGKSAEQKTTLASNYNSGNLNNGKAGTADKNLYIGGIFAGTSATLSNTVIAYNYNRGAITKPETSFYYVGGIGGFISGDTTSAFFENYNAAAMTYANNTNNQQYTGAVLGSIFALYSDTCPNNFYLNTDGSVAVGKGTALTTFISRTAEQMLDSAFLNDLSGLFYAADTGNINGGYPILYWQSADYTGDKTVTFHFNDTVTPDLVKKLDAGNTVDRITPPSRIGYTFAGWVTQADLSSDPFDFTSTITEDLELYAKWSYATYNITYYMNDGTDKVYTTQPYIYTDDTTRPKSQAPNQEPVWEGRQFQAWYTGELKDGQAELGDKYIFNQDVTGDLSLYANWRAVTPDYSWYSDPAAPKDPYQINTIEELYGLADMVNGKAPADIAQAAVNFQGKTISLGTDIDLKGLTWIPIGLSASTPFAGTFDGNGKKIENLKADDAGSHYQGLFGYVSGGTLKNVTIGSGTVSKGMYNGALAGYIDQTRVENCVNKATVNGIKNNSGGLVCDAGSESVITRCTNYGTVSGPITGGIVGTFSGSELSLCRNEGVITGTEPRGGVTGGKNGGIAGSITGKKESRIKVNLCVNTGVIQGLGSNSGGIAGITAYTEIGNSYNQASVSGVGNSGGLISLLDSNSRLYSSYSIGDISGQGTSVGAAVGEIGTNNLTEGKSTLTNVFVGTYGQDQKLLTVATPAQFSSGEVACRLNKDLNGNATAVWSQKDGYPIHADAQNKVVYRVAVASGIQHGTVSLDGADVAGNLYVRVDDKVYVNLLPDEGYIASLLRITDKEGNKLPTTKSGTDEEKYSFDMSTSDATVIAQFAEWSGQGAPASFKMKFAEADENETKLLEDATVVALGKLTPPASPEKANAAFIGWYTDKALKIPYDFDTLVTRDFTLYAKWKTNGTVTVTFDLNGGQEEAPDAQTVAFNSPVLKPADPERRSDGYYFVGWSTQRQGGALWNFATPVAQDAQDFTLYAQWTQFQGAGTAAAPYKLNDSQDLNQFATMVDTDACAGKYFELTQDVVLNRPIGEGQAKEDTVSSGGVTAIPLASFNGHFNGNGNTVTLNFPAEYANQSLQGMFAYLGTDSIVENVNVSGTVEGMNYVGGIAGYSMGTISNCTSLAAVEGRVRVGGIIGGSGLGGSRLISDCQNYGNVTGLGKTIGSSSFGYVGGIIGDIGNVNVEIKNCQNHGNVEGSYNYVGGIAGNVPGAKTLSGCTNSGSITGNGSGTYIGGLFGNSKGVISDCSNSGDVLAPQWGNVGGISGYMSGEVKGTAQLPVKNEGNITGKRFVGGIVGYSSAVISYAENTGEVKGETVVGGISGRGLGGTITRSRNTGAVTCTLSQTPSSKKVTVGGIAGDIANVSYSYNLGTISAPAGAELVGGVTGQGNGVTTIKSSFSYELLENGMANPSPGAPLVVGDASDNNNDKDDKEVQINRSFYCTGTNQPSQDPNALTVDQFAGGEAAYRLDNGGTSPRDGVWGQQLPQPVLPDSVASLSMKMFIMAAQGSQEGDPYPHWTDQDHPPIYKVTVKKAGDGSGTLKANSKNVEGNDLELYVQDKSSVTLEVKPNSDSKLAGITVDGADYDYTEGDSSQSIPVDPVSVDGKDRVIVVTFEKKPVPVNNTAPTVGDYNVSTDHNTAVSGKVTGLDADGDTLAYSKGSDPAHGTVTVSADGSWTYQPASGYSGSDSFTVKVSDTKGASAISTISITVKPEVKTPVNTPPTAGNYSVTADYNTAVSGKVTGSDADGDTLTYSKGSNPAHGTVSVNPDGSWTYQPNSGYSGSDSFTVTVSDGKGGATASTITVTVKAENKPPVDPQPPTPPDQGNGTGDGSGTGSGDGSGAGSGNGSGSGSDNGNGTGSGALEPSNGNYTNIKSGDTQTENVTVQAPTDAPAEVAQTETHDDNVPSGGGGGGNNSDQDEEKDNSQKRVFSLSTVIEAIQKNPAVTAAVGVIGVGLLAFAAIRRYRTYLKNTK